MLSFEKGVSTILLLLYYLSLDGQVGQTQTYILPAPINIWGRDLLIQWGIQITLLLVLTPEGCNLK